jgi:RNA recognition motif-containing protein
MSRNTKNNYRPPHEGKGGNSSQHQDDINKFKIFVGGFPVEFSEADLISYMEQFGEVKEARLHLKRNGESKGFAFVYFREERSVKDVLKRKEHRIGSKSFECKPVVNHQEAVDHAKNEQKRKVFIGGLSKNVTKKDLEEYFKAFGSVQKVILNREHYTDISRGCGFVIFNQKLSVTRLLGFQGKHFLRGKEFGCKVCLHKDEIRGNKEKKSGQGQRQR